jgi:OOP family OmpA-OmpF porin
VFVPWANAVTEPGFYSSMGTMMMDPAGWTRMMGTAMDPNAYRNVAAFADPNVYMKWLAAGMDPSFYTALLTQLSDPNKMMRWMMMPMDPKMWNMMMQGMNPNMYMKWMMMPLDPKVWQMGMNTMNPNLYMSWLGAGMDPKTYGPWGAWLTPPTAGGTPGYTWPAPAAPAAGTAAPAFFNPFDPNTWNQMMAAPLAAAAPAPAKAAAPAAAPAVAAPAPAAAPAKAAPVAAAPAPAPAPAAPSSKTVLAGDALFKLGKSGIKDLTGEGKQKLDDLADQIKKMGEVEQIKIVGHADASGKAEANQKLSEARARSVKSYLVAKGVKSSVIVTSGAGSSQPVVQCDMKLPSKELAACLAPNRRVEVEIVGKAK